MYLAPEDTNPPQSTETKQDKPVVSCDKGMCAWFWRLSKSKRVILVVMSIWAAQAVPKWTVAITADGELSAKIMKVFITPKTNI